MSIISSSITCYVCTQPKGQNLPCETNVETVQQTQCTPGYSCIKYIYTSTYNIKHNIPLYLKISYAVYVM
ncbi:hypothetical protein NQ314_016731 [Rhamnusium bicolor]|uniref:Uncharacterized protein n=1 Tax=Rhamnusium bicolor TaxID=1586634 RepID=A0AAV8WV90_9CUCU|nr:hypothetical protein NQ314_016731 [Rhamnusium bicolor]